MLVTGPCVARSSSVTVRSFATQMLYLRTFGGLTLHNGAHVWPVNGGQRARHALLAVLAAAGERGVSRDRLFALFWPESDADRARGALKQALYTLRKELRERRLTLGNGVVRLNPDVIGSDVTDFDRALRAREHSRAVELYAGPFLDGFHLSGLPEFDNWLDRERARLATQYCGALRELALVAESAGDDAVAIAWWKKLSAADPLNAQPALSLIKALARTGDRVSALQFARTYQALVKAQLEVDADTAVESLVEKIRSGASGNELAGAVANGRQTGRGGVHAPSPYGIQNDDAESGPVASPTVPLREPDREPSIVAGAIMRRPWFWVGASGILLAGTVIGALAVNRDSPVRTPLRFTVELRAGERLAAVPSPLALSPDGTLLALAVARDSGASRIAVRAVGDMLLRELQGTEGASQLFFSPDGQWIGYHERGLLKKVPTGGGTPVLIGRVPNMFGAAWSRDGEIVVSSDGALAVIPAVGGTPRRISTPDTTAGEFSQRWPIVLDDGTIVYTARGRILDRSRIAVISTPGARQEILDLEGTSPLAIVSGHLLFSTARTLITPQNEIVAVRWDARRRQADGVPLAIVEQVGLDVQGAASASISASGSLAYYFDPEHRYQLVLANDRGDKNLALADSGPFSFPRFSPDGRRIAINLVGGGNPKVKVFDRESRTFTLLTNERAGYPEWTPDGKRIVFLRPGGNKGMWSKPVDLSGSEQLLARLDSLDIMEGAFSRDGRRLVVRGYRMRDSTDEFWYRHLEGDTAWRPVLTGGRRSVAPRLSPDGQWVAFSNSESGNHVYVTPVEGGPRFQVSLDRGWSPVWAPDGRRLFYFRGQQLVAAILRFTPSFAVVRRDVVLEGPYAAHGYHAQFDVSPDGREFALLRNVSPVSRLVFVHDWKDELRQRTARVVER